MTPGDDVTSRPDADDLLAGLDPELADVARRLVADAHGHVPGDVFAARLAGELRAAGGAGAVGSGAGGTHEPAPDDIGRSLPQPPLWARVAVGILSLTLVYGLIASVFRPATTPPVEVPVATPTVTAPASATALRNTVTPAPSPSVTPTPSVSPTATSRPAAAGPIPSRYEPTPVADPSATRPLTPTAAPTSAPMAITQRRSATPTPPRPTDTERPSSTPLPTQPPQPSTTPVTPDATPTEREPERPSPEPPTHTPDECYERCTRKAQAVYDDCIARGGEPAACRERQQEHRDQCRRDECEPTPAAER